ncbi:MAG: insulinase family protein, partial [Verrucomicrobia bacterium]|nr:insulinase family protein [Verrucomicrobiota bacterium]
MLNSENTIANETETEIPAIPAGVKLVTLDNGLTIIIREDHSAPVVSAQAWCKSGSINEGEWLGAGLSHVLEHMLFKGTENRGPGVIDRQIQEAGGYINAYTSFDRTVYWINVPNTGATTAVDILCDIMKNATLPPEELKKEQQVILREMDMNQDDPGRRSSRRLFETAYTKSLYRYTVIGYPDVFNKLEPDDIMAYYKKHYVPNNIFFVIAGDVDASKVEAQIREAFESTPMQPLPPQSMHEEPQQMAQRLLIEEAPIEMAHFHFGWHVPDIRHPDTPALDVLSTLLGDGRSSRLFRGVRETGLAHAVSAWVYSPGNTGLFGISAVCDADKFEAARGAILAEVERVKRGELTDDELEKARKQLLADTWSSKKTMQGQAQDLGSNWMAARDLNFSMRYLDTVNKLTTADLARVAEEYLSRRNRTLYSLMPEGTSPTQVEESEVFSDLPIEKHTLSNGMTLLFKEDKRLPFVEFTMVFKGGVLAESVTNNGVTQLMSK